MGKGIVELAGMYSRRRRLAFGSVIVGLKDWHWVLNLLQKPLAIFSANREEASDLQCFRWLSFMALSGASFSLTKEPCDIVDIVGWVYRRPSWVYPCNVRIYIRLQLVLFVSIPIRVRGGLTCANATTRKIGP